MSSSHHLVSQPIPGFGLNLITTCRVCGRLLTDPQSVAAGVGPVCSGRHDGGDSGVADDQPLDPFDPVSMDITMRRRPDGDAAPVFNIPQRHHHHSPTGMEFGYSGSGPADLALNILALFIPFDPNAAAMRLYDGTRVHINAWGFHQDFKAEILAPIPDEGTCLSGEEIRRWIDRKTGGNR